MTHATAIQQRADGKVMRVLFLSTSYPSNASDWRGVFIRHLVAALSRRSDIKLAVWAPPGELPVAATSITSSDDAAWLGQLMAAGGISHLMRSGGARAMLAPFKLLRMIGKGYRRNRNIDLYHVNWLQCALPLPRDAKPALITVLGNDMKLLRLPLMGMLLRRTMAGRKVAICPNAEWMQDPLQKLFGSHAEVVPVSFGIDPRWYGIERRLDESRPRRWLAVTRLTVDKLGSLFDWSEELFAGQARELHLFGPMQEGIAVPDWVHYHGAATPEQLATEWFPCAHGLITLSRHAEGRPQVMLEAMAAGLPIIASCMPAHAGIVQDGKTGILCDSADTYGAAMHLLEDAATNGQFSQAARSWAVAEIGNWDDCAERYTRIYRRLLGNESIE